MSDDRGLQGPREELSFKSFWKKAAKRVAGSTLTFKQHQPDRGGQETCEQSFKVRAVIDRVLSQRPILSVIFEFVTDPPSSTDSGR